MGDKFDFGLKKHEKKLPQIEIDKELKMDFVHAMENDDLSEEEKKLRTKFQQFCGGMESTRTNSKGEHDVYFLGIIDFLQNYGKKKKAESFFKGITHNPLDVSAL